MVRHTLEITPPRGYRLKTVVLSHGRYNLPPFLWEADSQTLRAIIRVGERPAVLSITQPAGDRLAVLADRTGRWGAKDIALTRAASERMLGLAINLGDFHQLAGNDYAWAEQIGAGRMLRGGSVFEDAVKMMATTNCSWSLTRQMVGRLVETLGERAPDGRLGFPTPQAMAEKTEEFYRTEIRAGYRSAYFKGFAEQVASGSLDPETWADFPGATAELTKEILKVKGLGRYAAENLCKLLGRFEGLGLDSWCLKKYPEVHGPVKGDVEKAIRKRYQPLGAWQGLALWLDLTRDWHEKGVDSSET